MYFYAYLIMCAFLLLEVIVGIVLDLFTENYYVEDKEVSLDTIESFRTAWIKRDPLKTMFVPVYDVPAILVGKKSNLVFFFSTFIRNIEGH